MSSSQKALIIALAGVLVVAISIYSTRNVYIDNSEPSYPPDPDLNIQDRSDSTLPTEETAIRPDTSSEVDSTRSARIVSDFGEPLSQSSRAWFEKNFVKNPAAVKYDRYRLAAIDLFQLLQPIKASPQFLDAAAGRKNANVESPDFIFRPFEDKAYRLVIRDALIQSIQDEHVIAVSGVSYDSEENAGQWSLVINESSGEVLGTIDSRGEWIKFWPSPTQSFHVFAELSQENRVIQQQQKSNW